MAAEEVLYCSIKSNDITKVTAMKKLLMLSLLPLISVAADKHVHGEANLYIVLDGADKVLVEFESPAANIIGFEHEPRTAKQHAAVANAVKELQNYKTLVDLPQGSCKLLSAKVTSPFKAEEHDHHNQHKHHDHHDDHKHDKHEHGHHDHHDEHKHAHHDEHKHEGHDDHDHNGHGEAHADFHAEYSLQCKQLTNIKQAVVTAFDHFAGMEKITVEWINDDKQGSAKSTKAKNTLPL